jgi:hypothetical protein
MDTRSPYHWTRILQLWLLVLAAATGALVMHAELRWFPIGHGRGWHVAYAEVSAAAAATPWLVCVAVVNLLRRIALR